MPDSWYYADYTGQNGPVTLQELQAMLARLPDPDNVLVWRAGFSDWLKAAAVSELKAQSRPPRLPPDQMPTWQVKWWWYPVPFISIGIGSQVGRKVMIWSAAQRRKARMQRKAGA